MSSSRVLALLAILCSVYGFTSLTRTSVDPVPEAFSQELTPPSELALMMRAMAIHADSVKAGLDNKSALPPFPKPFRKLLEAEATKGMHIDPITFPTFGNDYLKKLDRLYEVPKKDRERAYNALIQSCANCHGTHCPGPLMRIKKMYVELPKD